VRSERAQRSEKKQATFSYTSKIAYIAHIFNRFVNCSPAKYNINETFTSLTYASRVKNIQNKLATKNEDSAEITRLKNLLRKHGVSDGE
tara:strand:- start:119 stop:385 length:267 start_codon:yes stop_codon:yes gene_type:complete